MVDENKHDDEENRQEEENPEEEEYVDEEDQDEGYETIEEEESGNGGLVTFLIIFILLFLASTSFLFYFQFYQGNGEWEFTFKKNTGSAGQVEELKEENKTLSARIDSLEESSSMDTANVDVTGTSRYSNVSGPVYEVQIGAFRQFNPSKYEENLINMDISYEEGMVKLAIGRFQDLTAAKEFRRDIKRMGVRDAFIVKKENGVRKEIIHTR